MSLVILVLAVSDRYTTRKYNGDDLYSWAIFKKKDVKGMRSPIFMGEATPVLSGMARSEADYQKHTLEERDKEKNG